MRTPEQVEYDDRNFMIQALDASIRALHVCGVPTERVECGPATYDFIVDYVIFSRSWKVITPTIFRRQLQLGAVDLHFHGCVVSGYTDVPEGAFWPSRRKEYSVHEPISDSTAFA